MGEPRSRFGGKRTMGGFTAGIGEVIKKAASSSWTAVVLGLVGIAVGLPAVFVSPVAAAIVLATVIVVSVAVSLYGFMVRERFGGAYEVLESHVKWTVQDDRGAEVEMERQSRLRFLQNEVIAISDFAWPQTQAIKSYSCSPGIKVDQFPHADKLQFVISLRDVKHRGDEQTYTFRRVLVDQFLAKTEWVGVDVRDPTGTLTMKVVLPSSRPATKAWGRVRSKPKHKHDVTITNLPGGNQQLEYSPQPRPKLNEAYYIEWEW